MNCLIMLTIVSAAYNVNNAQEIANYSRAQCELKAGLVFRNAVSEFKSLDEPTGGEVIVSYSFGGQTKELKEVVGK